MKLPDGLPPLPPVPEAPSAETPETDANREMWFMTPNVVLGDGRPIHGNVVDVEFARGLERRARAAEAELNKTHPLLEDEAYLKVCADLGIASSERDALKAENRRLRELTGDPVSLMEAAGRPKGSVSLIHQYDAEACCVAIERARSERDRLRAALERIANGKSTYGHIERIANEALAGKDGRP